MIAFADGAAVVTLGTAIMVVAMLATRRLRYITARWCWVLLAMSGFTAACFALAGRWWPVAAWTFTASMWWLCLLAAHRIERAEARMARMRTLDDLRANWRDN